MKSLRASMFSLLLLTMVSGTWAADGRILSFEGDVRVNGQQVTADTVLSREDIIVTGADGEIKFVLSDNSIIDMDSGSELAIIDYVYDPEDLDSNNSEMDLLAGTLRYVSGKISKNDPEDISFTAGGATIGVRGTYISITACPELGCD
ncbi:MAG: FecR domain-containing protein [Halioglobus sp.]